MTVLDASIALSWIFEDERDAVARASASAVLDAGAVVPPIWSYEVENALLMAERRGRLSSTDVSAKLRQLEALPIERDPCGPTLKFGSTAELARRLQLSVYDATYIDLALRRGLRLMTREKKLLDAADTLKIRWIR